MDNVAFSLISCNFVKAQLDLEDIPEQQIEVRFNPSGIFYHSNKTFILTLDFAVRTRNDKKEIFNTISKSKFVFSGNIASKDDIPPFFYANSIAIIYPYIRAFVSTVTLQAINHPLVLPTMNLFNLKDALIKNTVEE